MSGLRTDGLGVGPGQPSRSDQLAEDAVRRLNPGQRLEIPETGVNGPKNQPNRPEPGRQGHEALNAAGDRWAQGSTEWERFRRDGSRQAGTNQGSVAIDQPQGTQAPVTMKLSDLVHQNWATHAAELHEWARVHGERVGVDAKLKLPAEGPESSETPASPGGTRNMRRPFRVA